MGEQRRTPGRYGIEGRETSHLETWLNTHPEREYVVHLELPDPQLMEIASDAQGRIWVNSFTPGPLFCLHPGTGTVTSYVTSQGSERSGLYRLLVTSAGDALSG